MCLHSKCIFADILLHWLTVRWYEWKTQNTTFHKFKRLLTTSSHCRIQSAANFLTSITQRNPNPFRKKKLCQKAKTWNGKNKRKLLRFTRGTKEKHELFPGSNLCTPPQLTNLSLSLTLPPFCCFCREICPLSGYHALSEHLPPSGPIFRKQMGSKAIPLPLQTAESSTLRAHLHTVALPETSHPWQGAHSAHTSHSRSKPCLIYLLYFS